jgi:hypothetical protein
VLSSTGRTIGVGSILHREPRLFILQDSDMKTVELYVIGTYKQELGFLQACKETTTHQVVAILEVGFKPVSTKHEWIYFNLNRGNIASALKETFSTTNYITKDVELSYVIEILKMTT